MSHEFCIGIIDDDASIGDAVGSLVRSIGFHVTVFASAEEFLTSKALSGTLCAVVDVQMPGISGLDLQRSLAAAGWRIPLVFITGYADAGVRDQALQAGTVCCLPKPCDEIDLIAAIRAALESRDYSALRRINDDDHFGPPLQSSRVLTPRRRRLTQ